MEQIFKLFVYWILFGPFIMVLIKRIIHLIKNIKDKAVYLKTNYYKETKIPYKILKNDKGKYGEYLTYLELKSLETSGAKFLFNAYIPKSEGETSELDLIMISQKGIFVFESKNYSGWIFGDDNQHYWYQTLPIKSGKSQKEMFYNPVKQNQAHINHLNEFLKQNIDIKSFVVFANRCTLNNVSVNQNKAFVVYRKNVLFFVNECCRNIEANLLSESEVENIYSKLYPCTKVDNRTKNLHDINLMINNADTDISRQSF